MHPAGERRRRFSPDMDGVLVEPTNQETVLGEVHDYVATVPAGCAGDWEGTAAACAHGRGGQPAVRTPKGPLELLEAF